MARPIHRLSAAFVKSTQVEKLHSDGGNLYLRVEAGNKGWIFKYGFRNQRKVLGLGGYPAVSLAKARSLAVKYRQDLAAGIDPRASRDASRQPVIEVPTFSTCAAGYIKAHGSGWGHKHAEQWVQSLRDYAGPIADLPVSEVDTVLVIECLKPIWYTKPVTAKRVRVRIETVLNYAAVKGYRGGENPARLKGHIDLLLPAEDKKAVKHHKALPFAEIPAFMAKLRQREGISYLALEFCVLTASRTSEVRGAVWSEVSGDLWTIPAERMKASVEHKVPLSPRCVEIIESLRPLGEPYIFPGYRGQLSKGALSVALGRAGCNATVHGFRSTFRDWVEERTNTPYVVAEQALAHKVGSDVERSYRRTDLLEKRAKLMNQWSAFCESRPGEVISITG